MATDLLRLRGLQFLGAYGGAWYGRNEVVTTRGGNPWKRSRRKIWESGWQRFWSGSREASIFTITDRGRAAAELGPVEEAPAARKAAVETILDIQRRVKPLGIPIREAIEEGRA